MSVCTSFAHLAATRIPILGKTPSSLVHSKDFRVQSRDFPDAPGNRRKRPQWQVTTLRMGRGPRGGVNLHQWDFGARILEFFERWAKDSISEGGGPWPAMAGNSRSAVARSLVPSVSCLRVSLSLALEHFSPTEHAVSLSHNFRVTSLETTARQPPDNRPRRVNELSARGGHQVAAHSPVG
jgi:hypothetical protein